MFCLHLVKTLKCLGAQMRAYAKLQMIKVPNNIQFDEWVIVKVRVKVILTKVEVNGKVQGQGNFNPSMQLMSPPHPQIISLLSPVSPPDMGSHDSPVKIYTSQGTYTQLHL